MTDEKILSFRADLSQHIGNIIPRSGPRLGDSSDAPRTGLKAKAWTDVYVKVEKIDVYQECFEDIKDRWNSVQQFIAEDLEAVDVDLDDHPLPEPDLPPENNGTLYVSERDYLEQLQHYRAYRHGEEVDDG